MSIALAFLAAFFASLTAILAKLGMEDVDSNLATAIRTVVVVIMAFLIVIFTGQLKMILAISWKALWFIILSGLATGLSWLCFFRAIAIGDVSKVVPIDQSSIALTILFSLLILGEPATPQVIVGGLVITSGTFILIGRLNKKRQAAESPTYLVYALLAAVFAALTAILAKLGMEDVDSNLATLLRTIVVLIFAWAIVLFQRKQHQLKHISRKGYLFLILSGVATGLSWLCYFAAIALGHVSIVAPIDKFSVVMTMVLSFLVLKEKATKQKVIGGMVITMGLMFLLV